MSDSTGLAHPTVLLLHECGDGTRHVDWLIAQDSRGSGPLVSFRLSERLDTLAGGQRLDAERITDHRPAYLDYEGPISGDRGTVTRLARGTVLSWQRHDDAWRLEVRWGACSQRLRMDRDPPGGSDWVVTVID